MLQNVFVVALLCFACEVLSQECYTEPNCQGASFPVRSAKECCLSTDHGLSYLEGGSCTVAQCIVHGFAQASYDVVEGERLDTRFGLNVKGATNLSTLVITGTITSEAGTARTSDFENLQAIHVENSTDIRLFTTNDEVTLEYEDTVILRFTPQISALDLVKSVEGAGEYIRDTSTVFIIDNDRLEINVEEADYSILEGEAENTEIKLQFRTTQSPFTVTVYPVNSTQAIERFHVGDFFTGEIVDDAIEGEDFTDTPFTITVPATQDFPPGPIVFVIPDDFDVIDDDVDEIEQSFALVVEIGDDVPENFACFQRQVGDSECFGRRGATEIKIVDNDEMIIGFTQRRQTVSESDAPEGADSFSVTLDVHSLRFSETEYEILFRALENSNASVEAFNVQFQLQFDALFGNTKSPEAPIIDSRRLSSGNLRLSNTLTTMIVNDFVSEDPLKCLTVRILSPDVVGDRKIFTCNEDIDAQPDFFCLHTICIEDDDEPFVVAFVQTTYTVIESEGQVQVCVNLTRPMIDILEETVLVETFNDESSIYIPPNAVLATPDPPNFLGVYSMAPMADYEEQIKGINRIRDTVINATRRIICYSQIIYDDVRLEVSEYAGLTLAVRNSSVLTLVQPMYDQVSIQILDDDAAVVGLERTLYEIQEDVGVVELCAVIYSPTIDCPIALPFNVSLSTSDNTAVNPMDYLELNSILSFDACQTRRCVNVTIVDDLVDEPLEYFDFTLERTPDLDTRISLNPVDGQISIVDNDVPITVGYEFTVYTASEGEGMVELSVIIFDPPSGGAPRPFTLSFTTEDGTAESPGDYVGLMGEPLQFNQGDERVTHIITINQDDICENDPYEDFFSKLTLESGVQPITVIQPRAQVIIFDNMEVECSGVLVNDTLTGDPLMTVPIFTELNVTPGDSVPSLCYEVHGEANTYFNLITDECIAVNAYYQEALTPSADYDLNVFTQVGVRAVGNSNVCWNIQVDLDMCRATVNGEPMVTNSFDGISVKRYDARRVRISVPNCGDTMLVMWVMCRNGSVKDPVTWEYFNINFIRFVVMRGLNLNDHSHGLIGQFWNVPVTVVPFEGEFGGIQRDDDYVITVSHPDSTPRSFVGLRSGVTWEFEKRVCYYVGNTQAGKVSEVSEPNDPVIEGDYSEYTVESLFATEFTYMRFNDDRCL